MNLIFNNKGSLKKFLDECIVKYNCPEFITEDPISIPHQFTVKQDIEISGLLTAMISWGQRKSILKSAHRLMKLMDGRPYDFILKHTEKDRMRFKTFVHRTFNGEDAIYMMDFLQDYYKNNKSLEQLFTGSDIRAEDHVGPALIRFRSSFIEKYGEKARLLKHISSPQKGSRCKRLLMYLRWMVRKDASGVDFGLWKQIRSDQLLLPLDVHVENTARALGLLNRKQMDWKAVVELTNNCRLMNPEDPASYDFALFGLGVEKKAKNLTFTYEVIRR